jgi:small-conductance mechanosensitive channel
VTISLMAAGIFKGVLFSPFVAIFIGYIFVVSALAVGFFFIRKLKKIGCRDYKSGKLFLVIFILPLGALTAIGGHGNSYVSIFLYVTTFLFFNSLYKRI